jgi:hypothetical protein
LYINRIAGVGMHDVLMWGSYEVGGYYAFMAEPHQAAAGGQEHGSGHRAGEEI